MFSLNFIEFIISLITLTIAYFITFTLANFTRAWMAKKMGDSTAEHAGFLTLNPLAHIDPLGAALLFLTGVGWGKHVPINPYAIYGRWTRLKLLVVYLSEVVAYFVTATIALLVLLRFFGYGVLQLAMPMALEGQIYLPQFTAQYPQTSSMIIALAFIIVAIIYMSIFWAVISFILDVFDLILILFYPHLYERKERDYMMILAPLLFMMIFAYPLRVYLLFGVMKVGSVLAQFMGI